MWGHSHPQSTGQVAGQPAHQPVGGLAGQVGEVLPVPAQQLLAKGRDHRQSGRQGTEDDVKAARDGSNVSEAARYGSCFPKFLLTDYELVANTLKARASCSLPHPDPSGALSLEPTSSPAQDYRPTG